MPHLTPFCRREEPHAHFFRSHAHCVATKTRLFSHFFHNIHIFYIFFLSGHHHYAAGEWPSVSGVCVFHGSRYSAKKRKETEPTPSKGALCLFIVRMSYVWGVESKGAIFRIGRIELCRWDLCSVWFIEWKRLRKVENFWSYMSENCLVFKMRLFIFLIKIHL